MSKYFWRSSHWRITNGYKKSINDRNTLKMSSREAILEALSIARAAGKLAVNHVEIRNRQLCDFYRSSILTKTLRLHDEMWEELHEKSQIMRGKEIQTIASTTSSMTSLNGTLSKIGKRSYSTKAQKTLVKNENIVS
ncbi:hypothetical protein WICMUC_004477 [Wickerhamomyces mucosus]|uniref:Uncharacterized protein n=1 Tax=Wickerhamomyces mucosus TaxID=1378264 RepID=A0A9P8PI24_9ASCO|nr:hypothetical protein WICMUC_004477 [Wickerhamomyces mucosus]